MTGHQVTGEELDASDRRVRNRILDVAYGEIENVRTSDYWRDVLGKEWQGPFPKHWCGAFALWCLHQVGAATQLKWEVGKGFLYRLPRAKDPQPGDIAYFDKPFQHHAVFVRFDGDRIITVDGNQGFPKPIKEVARPRDRVTAVYSVANFLPYLPSDTQPAPPPEAGDAEQP